MTLDEFAVLTKVFEPALDCVKAASFTDFQLRLKLFQRTLEFRVTVVRYRLRDGDRDGLRFVVNRNEQTDVGGDKLQAGAGVIRGQRAQTEADGPVCDHVQ